MQSDPIDPSLTDTSPLAVHDGLLLLQGYGVRVFVHRGQLAVSDNLVGNRREIELSRATCGLRRLVVIGHSGAVSIEALRWLRDLDAAFVAIDADARVVACYAPLGTNDVRLRRAQALAGAGPRGVTIARGLLQRKLAGQRAVLVSLHRSDEKMSQAIAAIDVARTGLVATDDLNELRWLESVAASAYWTVLSDLPVRFPRAEHERIRPQWRSVGARSSPLTGTPRAAATPFQAMLNYLLAVAETEARIAAVTIGLDSEMGFLHLDRRFRHSLANDVLEPIRSALEAYVLEIVRTRVLSSRDFSETAQGACRLMPVLARTLVRTAPLWAAKLSPVVRFVVQELRATRADSAERTPRRAIGRASVGTRIGTLHRRTTPGSLPKLPVAPQGVCAICGGALDSGRTYCPECTKIQRAEAGPRLQVAGPAAIARMRARGEDPTHGGRAGARRAAIAITRHREAREWRGGTPRRRADRERFENELLPLLRDVPLRAIVEATGLSKPQCSMIKRGLRVPHERHWESLRQLVETSEGAR